MSRLVIRGCPNSRSPLHHHHLPHQAHAGTVVRLLHHPLRSYFQRLRRCPLAPPSPSARLAGSSRGRSPIEHIDHGEDHAHCRSDHGLGVHGGQRAQEVRRNRSAPEERVRGEQSTYLDREEVRVSSDFQSGVRKCVAKGEFQIQEFEIVRLLFSLFILASLLVSNQNSAIQTIVIILRRKGVLF